MLFPFDSFNMRDIQEHSHFILVSKSHHYRTRSAAAERRRFALLIIVLVAVVWCLAFGGSYTLKFDKVVLVMRDFRIRNTE